MLRDILMWEKAKVLFEKGKKMQIVVEENSFLIGMMRYGGEIHNYYPFLIGLSCVFRDVYNVLRSMSLYGGCVLKGRRLKLVASYSF